MAADSDTKNAKDSATEATDTSTVDDPKAAAAAEKQRLIEEKAEAKKKAAEEKVEAKKKAAEEKVEAKKKAAEAKKKAAEEKAEAKKKAAEEKAEAKKKAEKEKAALAAMSKEEKAAYLAKAKEEKAAAAAKAKEEKERLKEEKVAAAAKAKEEKQKQQEELARLQAEGKIPTPSKAVLAIKAAGVVVALGLLAGMAWLATQARDEVAGLRDHLKEKQQEQTSSAAKRRTLEKGNEGLKASLEAAQEQIAANKSVVEEAASLRSSLQEQLNKGQQRLEEVKSSLEASRQERKKEESRAEQAEAKVVRLREQLQQVREELTRERTGQSAELRGIIERVRELRQNLEATLDGRAPNSATRWFADPAAFLEKLRKISIGEDLGTGDSPAAAKVIAGYQRAAEAMASGIIAWSRGQVSRTGSPGRPPNQEVAQEALIESRGLLSASVEAIQLSLSSGSLQQIDPESDAVVEAAQRYLAKCEEWLGAETGQDGSRAGGG